MRSLMMNQSSPMRRRLWGWLVGVVVSLVFMVSIIANLAMIAVLSLRSGIAVRVENTGQTPIRSLTLHVTGNSYSLGDLAAGAFKEATVKSTGESGLELEFENHGQARRLNAGGYFEPGYRGTIRVSIKDGVIDGNDQRITNY